MQQTEQPPAFFFHNFPGFIQRLKKTAEQIPFFLLTLPLFVIIHIEKQYHHFIVYSFVYKEILWLIAAPFFIFLLSYLLLRNSRRASLFSFVLLMFFYFFCDLKDWLHEATSGTFASKYIFLLPFIFLIIVIVFIIIKKTKSHFSKLFLYINTTFVLFILIDVTGILFNTSVYKNDLGDRSKTILSQYKPCNECIKPDIYYFIFDEYSSSEVLQKEFNYQNSLDSFLKEKKFRVIPFSKSNYNLTPFSIASCFNLNYLPGLDVHKDFYMKDYLPGLPSVYKSELIPILQKEGYQIINLSIFNIENHKPVIPPFDLWELNTLYGRHNIFKKIDYDIGWLIRSRLSLNLKSNVYRNSRNEHFKKSFEKLMQTIRQKSFDPKFIYAHFMLPHGPYCFDSAGNQIPVSELPLSEAENKQAYVNQVIYTNTIMKKIIDEIFLDEKKRFLIIIQGDHGYKYHDQAKNQLEFGNLNAMYFYNQDYHLINDSTSNVNTFRIVLNSFFKKNFKMLKDTSYFLQYK
jgi:hypothetical protein